MHLIRCVNQQRAWSDAIEGSIYSFALSKSTICPVRFKSPFARESKSLYSELNLQFYELAETLRAGSPGPVSIKKGHFRSKLLSVKPKCGPKVTK